MPTFNQDKINKELLQKSSEFQTAMLIELRSYIERSSSRMSECWDQWDMAQANFKGYRVTDKEDRASLARGEPVKIIVPITYAQVQTATAFLYSLFTQKERLFEFTPEGPEDASSIEAIEVDINYQMVKNKFLTTLYQWLNDICKYGVGVMKVCWEEDYQMMRVIKRDQQLGGVYDMFKSMLQGQMPARVEVTSEEVKSVLKYQGNKIENISPYAFFPDVSVPVAKFQDGGFVAHEEIVGRDNILSKEGKLYFGTEFIKPYSDVITGVDTNTARKRWFDREYSSIDRAQGFSKVNKSSIVYTEIQFTMVPKEWTEKFNLPFGDESDPIKFVAVIANDTKIIRFERLNYLHGNYTYIVAEYNPDHNSFISSGMAESIRDLQDFGTWLLNSHMANVKKLIKNQVLADTTKVHVEDIETGKTVIRSKGSPTADISKAVYQFSVQDATNGHVAFFENVLSLVQLTTGVNENALGQYAPGRRSAAESKQVNAGAALRLKSLALNIWANGLEKCGQQVLANTRQARTKEVYDKIQGTYAEKAPYEKVILVDPEALAGGYDLLPWDGTLPSEKDEQASYLLQLFQLVMGQPQAAQMFNIDPNKMLLAIAELKGVKNLQDFAPTPPPQVVPQGQPQGSPQYQALPDAQIQQMLGSEQLQPLANTSLLNALQGTNSPQP